MSKAPALRITTSIEPAQKPVVGKPAREAARLRNLFLDARFFSDDPEIRVALAKEIRLRNPDLRLSKDLSEVIICDSDGNEVERLPIAEFAMDVIRMKLRLLLEGFSLRHDDVPDLEAMRREKKDYVDLFLTPPTDQPSVPFSVAA